MGLCAAQLMFVPCPSRLWRNKRDIWQRGHIKQGSCISGSCLETRPSGQSSWRCLGCSCCPTDSSSQRISLISPPALLIFALGDLIYPWWIWKALIMRDIRIWHLRVKKKCGCYFSNSRFRGAFQFLHFYSIQIMFYGWRVPRLASFLGPEKTWLQSSHDQILKNPGHIYVTISLAQQVTIINQMLRLRIARG